jgi:Histone acetylation protein.
MGLCSTVTVNIFPSLKKSNICVSLASLTFGVYVFFFPQIFSLQEESEAGPDGKKKGQKKAKKSNKSKANQRKNSKKSNTPQTGNDLSAKIFATMEKHKEVFFVIRLHSAQSAASLAVSIHFENCLSECVGG